jgi:phosphate-selective porin OprO/OprP
MKAMRYNICFIGFLFLGVIQMVGATPPNPISSPHNAISSSPDAIPLSPDAIPSPHDAMNTEFRFKVLEEALSMKADRDELKAGLSLKADKPDPAKGFTTKIDGRIFFDSYHFSGDRQSNTSSFHNDLDYNGIKDLRVGVTGNGYRNYAYKLDLFFGTGNTVEIRDVWLSASNVPFFDTLKVGHQRVEEGLSALQAGFHTMFIPFEGADFVHFYRFGISSRHLWAQDRLRFFAGLFEFKPVVQQNRNETVEHAGWGTIANVRLTYLPYISKDNDGNTDGKKFMLFGFNYGYYDVNHPEQSFNERYGQLFGSLQRLNIDRVDNYQQVGLEFAVQQGLFALLSETYLRTYHRTGSHNDSTINDLTIWGMYLEGRVFLTGDYRRFNAAQAVWGAVRLKHNLEFETKQDWNLAKYFGAWELAGKWSYTDLTNLDNKELQGVFAPRVHDFTLGLNWYWSERIRVMFNYSRIIPTDKTGKHSKMDMFAATLRYHF